MTHLLEKHIIAVAASGNRLRRGSHRLVYRSTAWLCEIATGATETIVSLNIIWILKLNKVGLEFFGHLMIILISYKIPTRGHCSLTCWIDEIATTCKGSWDNIACVETAPGGQYWSSFMFEETLLFLLVNNEFLQIIGKVYKGCFVKLGRRGAPSLSRGWACLS